MTRATVRAWSGLSGIVAALFMVSGCPASRGAAEAPARPQADFPAHLSGSWRVHSWAYPGIGAVPIEQVRALVGKTVTFARNSVVFEGHRCAAPKYELEEDTETWRKLEHCKKDSEPGHECKFLLQEDQFVASCLGKPDAPRVRVLIRLDCQETAGLPTSYVLLSDSRMLGNLEGPTLCFQRTATQ